MTREQLVEALAQVIGKSRDVWDSDRETARAVLELVGPKRLVWKSLGDGKGRYRLDSSISVASHINGPYFVSLPCNSGSDYYWSGPNHSRGKYYPTLEAAKAAAEAHHFAQWLASCPLGDMIGGNE